MQTKDRIVMTSQFPATNRRWRHPDALMPFAGANQAQFFAKRGRYRPQGLEDVADYAMDTGVERSSASVRFVYSRNVRNVTQFGQHGSFYQRQA